MNGNVFWFGPRSAKLRLVPISGGRAPEFVTVDEAFAQRTMWSARELAERVRREATERLRALQKIHPGNWS